MTQKAEAMTPRLDSFLSFSGEEAAFQDHCLELQPEEGSNVETLLCILTKVRREFHPGSDEVHILEPR